MPGERSLFTRTNGVIKNDPMVPKKERTHRKRSYNIRTIIKRKNVELKITSKSGTRSKSGTHFKSGMCSNSSRIFF